MLCEDTTKPSSSAKMMVTSALTSTTVEATTFVHEPVPAPLLTSMGVVDAQLPTEVHVCGDIVVDVATDANTNKQGGHSSPGTDIAAVVENILQEEGKKSTDSHAIGDPVEPELEEVPIEAMEDIDKGQPETKGIVDAHEPNVFLEHVGYMKTILED
jgi:hypothetical protein